MGKTDRLPGSLKDQARFQSIATAHVNALTWKRQSYIPLGIIVQNPENTKGLRYDQWLEPEPFFDVQASILRDTLTVVRTTCRFFR